MGTRGLLGFVRKDGTRNACWNHMDSYPLGLGRGIVGFLMSLTPLQIIAMAWRIEQMNWVLEDGVPDGRTKALYVSKGFHTSGFRMPERTAEETVAEIKTWSDLLRSFTYTSWEALPHIGNGDLRHLIDASHLSDNCEWVYYIDFYKRTMEIHGDGHDITVTFDKLVNDPDWINSLQPEGSRPPF